VNPLTMAPPASPTASDVLRCAGFPPRILTLDFETLFAQGYSLGSLGVVEYVGDPRFHAHGVAAALDGKTGFYVEAGKLFARLTERLGAGWPGVTVVAHNAHFDLYVLSEVYGVTPEHCLCSMFLAYPLHGRGNAKLADLATAYGLPAKGELNTKGLRDLNRTQIEELAKYARHDAWLTDQIVRQLLVRTLRPEIELPLIRHTIHAFVDRDRGITLDADGARSLRTEVRRHDDSLCTAAGVSPEVLRSPAKFKKTLGDLLIRSNRKPPTSTAKDSLEVQALTKDANPEVRVLVEARLAVASSVSTVARLDSLVRRSELRSGTVPPQLVYYGGHTGRWSSTGANLQNLPARGSGFNTRIRGLLVARTGCVFVVADLAQIEARILAYLAKAQDLLVAFGEGRDVYSEFSRRVFGEEVRKPRAEDPPERSTRLKALRNLGKAAVLGLGYRMGALRFWEGIEKAPELRPLVESGEIAKATAAKIVREYRSTFAEIPALWKSLDQQLHAVASGQTAAGPLLREGKNVYAELLSGRRLLYRDVRFGRGAPREREYLDSGGNLKRFKPKSPEVLFSKPAPEALHGGKLTENIVQALARDVLGEALLRLEDDGLRVLLHVHDEVIVEVPACEAAAAERLILEVLRTPPAWAPGLPLDAEAHTSRRYGKGPPTPQRSNEERTHG
jgi:DNA polymerase I-like protein with 3'-5' exonuclease and polymerase domains